MINFKKDTDQIVTLTLDMEGRSINVINHQIADAFLPVIEHLIEEKKKGELKGVIITSAKKSFLAGGDLDYLYQANDSKLIFDYSQKIQKIYRGLERPGVPVVAAMNGSALGGGFELALACHHRIIVDNPKIRVGHPEVNLGMMPGGGGVIRLLWTLGLEKAFPILANGHRYSPKEALKTGIVDALAENKKKMLEMAKTWLLENQDARRPWDTKEGCIPYTSSNEPDVTMIARRSAAALAEKTYNNYAAPQTILNTLAEGSKVDFDTACKIESRNFAKLLLSKPTKNMIKTFWYDFNAIKEGKNRPKGFGKFRPKKVGIIGAGMMGSGIAYICASRGLDVVVKDISKPVAQRASVYVERMLTERIEDGRLTSESKEKILARVMTTDSAEEFTNCDIVIEVVFENQMVKAKATREAEAYMDEFAIFASNTLSIPITKLAKASERPENFVGLHFFPPVEKVPLVEIVRGKETSDETIARAVDFAKAIRKTPIIVKDNWGFYVARVQNTYILEGITMLQEGFAPPLIENLALQAGMVKSPLLLADQLSLPIIMQYEQQAAEHYGAKYIQHPAISVLYKMIEELKREGKARKKGFYEYEKKETTNLWQELTEAFPTTEKEFSREEIIERLLFVQILEAIWCLQEKIIESVPEGNLGSILGWGFPAFKGGVFQYVDDYGLEKFVDRCKHYEEIHGPRFRVPKLLLKKLEKGVLFSV